MKTRKRPRRSIIWTTSKEEFEIIIKNSNSIGEILSKFGLVNKGGNYKTINQRIEYENINIDHILKNYKNKTQNAIINNTTPLEEILVENSKYTRNATLKKRLFAAGLLEDKCYECGQLPLWNGKPLVLHLDHINGVHDDNRSKNLRILCPHCHSQTETFAGRNKSSSR